MKYEIHDLSRSYVKAFVHFLAKKGIEANSSDAFELFCYSIKSICSLEVIEYNQLISKQGEKGIKSLLKVKNVKLDVADLTLEERIALVECSKIYFSIILQGLGNTL